MITEPEFPFRYAERCLYEYQGNVARLDALKERLAALYATSTAGMQGWSADGHGSSPGDPVAVRELRIISLEEEITRLAERTEPITKLKADLEAPYVLEGSPKHDLARVMRLYYFGGNDKKQAAKKLNMSRRSLYRRRTELVHMTISYFGFQVASKHQ